MGLRGDLLGRLSESHPSTESLASAGSSGNLVSNLMTPTSSAEDFGNMGVFGNGGLAASASSSPFAPIASWVPSVPSWPSPPLLARKAPPPVGGVVAAANATASAVAPSKEPGTVLGPAPRVGMALYLQPEALLRCDLVALPGEPVTVALSGPHPASPEEADSNAFTRSSRGNRRLTKGVVWGVRTDGMYEVGLGWGTAIVGGGALAPSEGELEAKHSWWRFWG